MENASPATERSLYRKYRSKTFSDIVGQEHVKQTLRNAVRHGGVGHAYLLTGPRGTGKTSMARILARAVNCLDPQDGEPCNRCESCRSMLENRCLDLAEIDAASKSKVEEMRDLLDKVGYAPTTIKRKVYIIDEVHMLSNHAFNALLKTLEEPPPHVLFALATTDVHKVPATITSRCQRLDLKVIALRDIAERMAYVCGQEIPPIEAEMAALELIAQQATGSLRDALSLLEQVHAYDGSAIGMAQVEEALGLARGETLARITDYIVAGDSGASLALIEELAASGADMRQYAKQLVQYWRDLLLYCAGGAASLGRAPDERLAEQAGRLSVQAVTHVFKAIMQPDYSGRRSASAQWQLELAVVEACEYFAAGQERPRDTAPAARAPVTAPAPTALAGPPERPMPSPSAIVEEPPPSRPAVEPSPAAPADLAAERPAQYEMEEPPPAQARAEPAPQASADRPAPQVWADVLSLLTSTPEKRRVGALFKESCVPLSIDDGAFVLGFFPQFSIIKDRAEKESNRSVVEQALAQVLGRSVALRFDIIREAPATVGAAPASSSESFVRRAEREILSVHIERDPR